jgi:hypothetical protein
MEHINLLMDENKCKIDPTNRMKILIVVRMTKIVEIWLVLANIPKFSRKQLQVACNCKWIGYILADFYQ